MDTRTTCPVCGKGFYPETCAQRAGYHYDCLRGLLDAAAKRREHCEWKAGRKNNTTYWTRQLADATARYDALLKSWELLNR